MTQRTTEPYEFLRIAVMLIALLSLAAICLYLMSSSFRISSAAGVRSMAGIMLPLVVGGFLAVFKRSLFEKASALSPVIAFLLAVGFAIVVMILIRNTAPRVRVDQALRFFWGPLTAVAVVAVALAAVGW